MKAELLILGALHRGAMHPYEIRRRFRSALVECYTDVDVGTLYYAVRQLAAAGHIEAHKVERVARGGNRTTYRITPRGRARFQELLNEQFRVEGVGSTSLYSALLFLHLADLPNVAVLLRERLARLEGAISEGRVIRRGIKRFAGTGVRHLMDHLAAQRALDRKWLRRLLRDVETGNVRDSELRELHASMPGSAVRRDRRTRTGATPPRSRNRTPPQASGNRRGPVSPPTRATR